MTDTSKPVTRRSMLFHPRHQKRVIATLGPEDVISVRLERGQPIYLSLTALYDIAELRAAAAVSGCNTAPCKNPFKARNV